MKIRDFLVGSSSSFLLFAICTKNFKMVPLEQIQSTLIISGVFYVLIGYLFGAGETSKTALVASLKSKRNTLYKCLLVIGALGVIKLVILSLSCLIIDQTISS